MSAISKAAFVDLLKQSLVVPSRKLEAWLTPSQLENSSTAAHLAKALVDDGLLTTWQAKFLLTGRHRLQVGNYVLLEPIRKDEYGDRFLAIHSSLARKVELQIFAGQVTKDSDRRNELIQKTTRIAKLDHPALVHVYDFDYESRRYYLVVEHVEGEPLDLETGTRRSAVEVATILSHAIEGLGFAHHHGVTHGSLIPQDLILARDGSVKIQNLAMEIVRRPDGAVQPLRPEDDFQAVANIGLTLLKSIPDRGSEANSGSNKSLEAILGRLRAEGVMVLPDLKAWIAEQSSDPTVARSTAAGSNASRSGAYSRSAAANSLEEGTIADAGWVARHWQEHPVHVIATAAVLLLGAALGITWLAYQLTGSGNVSDVARKPEAPSNTRQSREKNLRPRAATQSDGDATLVEENVAPKASPGDGAASTADPLAADTNQPQIVVPDPSAAQEPAMTITDVARSGIPAIETPASADSQLIAVESDTPPTADVASETSPVPGDEPGVVDAATNVPSAEAMAPGVLPVQVPAASTTPDKLTEISGVGEKTEQMLNTAGVRTFAQLASLETDKLKQILRDAGRFGIQDQDCENIISQAKARLPAGVGDGGMTPGLPATGDGSPVVDLSQPFANFPRQVALPPPTQTEELKLADLVIRPQYLLGLEIISPVGIARTKTIFDVERSSEDNQAWVVGYRRTARQKSEPVARIRKTESALVFQWLPDAENNRSAQYLQNCFLKLATPDDQSTVISLRQPLLIPPLRLDPGNLTDDLELDLSAMPDLGFVQIDIEKFKDGQPDIDVVMPRVSASEPGQILLKPRQKNGFLWVQVAGDVRSKIKIQANVVMMNAQFKTALITNPSVLDATLIQLQQIKTVATLKYTQMNTNDSAKKDARIEMERAEEAVNTMQVYLETLKRLLQEPILIRISADFDGYQVVLAQSDPDAVPVEPSR